MGLLAGIIASILLIASVWWIISYEPGMVEILTPKVLIMVCGSVLASGIIITGLSALFSINSFLRMKGNQMFHI